MAIDDMVPDSALVHRVRRLMTAVDELYELVLTRRHLSEIGGQSLVAASSALGAALETMEESAEPDDEINAKYRSRMRNEYILTVSGIEFFVFDPKPEEVFYLDILTGLTNTCRFAGQLPRFLSVAEHSIKVAAIAEHIITVQVREGEINADMIPLTALYALLHDAHEAYTGDIPRPLKARLADVFGAPWNRIEQGVQDAIHEAFALPPCPVEVEQAVRAADDWMLYCETTALGSKSPEDYATRITVPPPEVLVIGRVKAEEPDRKTVRELFDSEIRRLVRIVGGHLPEKPGMERRDPPPSRTKASAAFAQAVQAQGIPGDRPNPPPPPDEQEQYVPDLSRTPRTDDVSEGQWQNAVRSSNVDVPDHLLRELMDDPKTTEEERQRLTGLGGDKG